jgi:hypothetical protein
VPIKTDLSFITSEDSLALMTEVSIGTKQSNKKLLFTLLSAFFNYIKNSVDPDFQNPFGNPVLQKLFMAGKLDHFEILEKEVVDEILFQPLKGIWEKSVIWKP